MQQFFINQSLNLNERIELDKDIFYQLKKVLRANDKYQFRLVDINKQIFLCELNGSFAYVIKELNENNELDIDITVILALIKNDKMDFAIQKLSELGVKRIVPYKAYRSVVKEGKGSNKIDRYKKIAKEASEQSHRNIIPEIMDYVDINDLEKYKSDINIVAYEKNDDIKGDFKKAKSYTFIIGPEGGFDEKEIEKIINMGYSPISLGKRVLRAETAAIYLTSLIVGVNQ